MQESHNNHFKQCTFFTTISTPFELKTRGWSQIQAEEKMFPNPKFFWNINQKIQPLETATTSSNQIYKLQSKFSHQMFFLKAFLASPVTEVTPCVCHFGRPFFPTHPSL